MIFNLPGDFKGHRSASDMIFNLPGDFKDFQSTQPFARETEIKIENRKGFPFFSATLKIFHVPSLPRGRPGSFCPHHQGAGPPKWALYNYY